MIDEHPRFKYRKLEQASLVQEVEESIAAADTIFLIEQTTPESQAFYSYKDGTATTTLEAYAVDEPEPEEFWYIHGLLFTRGRYKRLSTTTEMQLTVEQRHDKVRSTVATFAIADFLGQSKAPFSIMYTLELYDGGSAQATVEQNAICEESGMDTADMTPYDFACLRAHLAVLANLRKKASKDTESIYDKEM